MSKIISFIRSEPVAVLAGVVNAALELVITLGVHLPPGVQAAILTLSLAVVAFITRRQVTPVDQGDGTGA